MYPCAQINSYAFTMWSDNLFSIPLPASHASPNLRVLQSNELDMKDAADCRAIRMLETETVKVVTLLVFRSRSWGSSGRQSYSSCCVDCSCCCCCVDCSCWGKLLQGSIIISIFYVHMSTIRYYYYYSSSCIHAPKRLQGNSHPLTGLLDWICSCLDEHLDVIDIDLRCFQSVKQLLLLAHACCM